MWYEHPVLRSGQHRSSGVALLSVLARSGSRAAGSGRNLTLSSAT